MVPWLAPGPCGDRVAPRMRYHLVIAMVLQSRTWIVNWHEERALAAVDIPLLGLPGQAPVWVEIEHDPNDTFVFLDFNSSAVTLHPVSLGSPQAACEKPYPGEQPYACR
ncbi:hypothetical protein ACFSKW_06915 [Nonomuraea mangrovi]|uniref:Uncharacterized protein n=2 Tax=Nonomuraea TaxID=83681 RepID=A0ABW4SNP3_9ACTN